MVRRGREGADLEVEARVGKAASKGQPMESKAVEALRKVLYGPADAKVAAIVKERNEVLEAGWKKEDHEAMKQIKKTVKNKVGRQDAEQLRQLQVRERLVVLYNDIQCSEIGNCR